MDFPGFFQKHGFKLVAFVVSAAALVLQISTEPMELKAKGMTPIIGISTSLPGHAFIAQSLRDPAIERQKPNYANDAVTLAHEIKQFRSDLTRAKGERALELNEQAYEASVALAYYLEDVVSGRADESSDRGKAAQSLSSLRNQTIQHALAFAKASTNKASKTRALYHVSVARYLSGQGQSGAVEAMRKLLKMSLDGQLKHRARLLVALHDIDNGSAQKQREAETTLRGLIRSLPLEASITARLAVARNKAGINRHGRRTARAQPAYRGYLIGATAQAAALNPADKEAVFNHAVAIWRIAEGANASWSRPPLKMAAYAATTGARALVERVALEDWQKNRMSQAIRKYEGLAASYAGNPLRGPIDLRILDMRRAEFAKTKSASRYERALVTASRAYLETGLLGDRNERKVEGMKTEIFRRHAALVHGELDQSLQKNARLAQRQQAITLASTYLSLINGNAEIEKVKAKVADIYALSGQHSDAVALYTELSETSVTGKARLYLTKAVASQGILAAWPVKAPWQGVKAGFLKEREDLLTLYGKLAQSSGKTADWFIMAHMGLLEINLGRGESAFKTWTAALSKNSVGPHAARAAGFMLVAYEHAKQWQNLEDLARLCQAANLAAIYGKGRVDTTAMLGLALLEGGKEAMSANNFKRAVTKLEEFVKSFPNAKNHDEGYYTLASAYRGAGQHKQAITTLLGFVERYPHTRYYQGALLNGGDWSAPMAYEENAIFFYSRFLSEFSRDANASRVRTTLKDLYLGRSLYAQATQILRDQVKDDSTEATSRQAALFEIMVIESRQGTISRAQDAAQALISSPAAEELKAQAYAFLAREHAKAGRFAAVQTIQTQLENDGGSSFEAQDALGEVRFLLAEAKSKTVIKEYFNLILTDPLKTINDRFAAYNLTRVSFQKVCEVGQTSYCAPAMHRLARLSEAFLRSLEDIEVQDTLAKNIVDGFQNRKQAILNNVTSTSQKSDDRAVAVVADGYTDPDWTQEVLWQNTADWNFERVSGETGNGYVQWSSHGVVK